MTGENGKKAYDHICNAQPLETPQYSDDERAEFNIEFSKLIPEIIENWSKLLEPVKAGKNIFYDIISLLMILEAIMAEFDHKEIEAKWRKY